MEFYLTLKEKDTYKNMHETPGYFDEWKTSDQK
jgi:hypothetical protein